LRITNEAAEKYGETEATKKSRKKFQAPPGLLGRRERKVKTQSQGKPVTDWQF
jgi:hypothetical protein